MHSGGGLPHGANGGVANTILLSRGTNIAALLVAVKGIVAAGVPKCVVIPHCKGGAVAEVINLNDIDPTVDSAITCVKECAVPVACTLKVPAISIPKQGGTTV